MSNRMRPTNLWTTILTLMVSTFVVLTAFPPASAQSLESLLKQSNLIGRAQQAAPPKVTVKLSPVEDVAAPGEEVTLSVHIEMADDAYTYSQNRAFGGATAITLNELAGLEPVDEAFTADREPKVQFEAAFQQEIEKFVKEVTFSRRFRLTGSPPPDQSSISGTVKFQVCDASSCTPFAETFEAFLESADGSEVVRDPNSDSRSQSSLGYAYSFVPSRNDRPDPLSLQFELFPANAQPGETVTLAVTMSLDEGWHAFGLIPHETQVSHPTVLELLETDNLRPLRESFEPVQLPETLDAGFDNIREHVHHGRVTWTQIFSVVEPGPYGVQGSIEYQACNKSCLPLKAVDFSLGSLQRAEDIVAAAPAASSFVPAVAAGPSVRAPAGVSDSDVQSEAGEAGLSWYLLTAFFGGLILNVMPCVLPVLAIKVMSFVQQAGESRGRVLLLNISYSLGVIGVFLLLASLAVTLKLGWGGLFQKPEFNLAMIAIIFAMGLSMLGVFEIPIPGMVGSAGGQHREGLPGAFMTGIFATLLATPCSGPLMTSTLAWSVKQTAPVVFLVWGVMGLGMASPYLLVGLFPKLVHFLPRPGMWMVRFKEFAGFALMGAAIYLMYSLRTEAVLPVLILLLGIGIASWMVGTLYNHASSLRKKMGVRLSALTVAILISGVAWDQYVAAITPSQWEPFSAARVAQLRKEGRPILIDFTAAWCAICQTNKRVALKTEETTQFLNKHGVVALVADYTHPDPEIKEWLDRYNSISLPLYVIFPPDNTADPLVFDGVLTQSRILDKLNEALSEAKTADAGHRSASLANTAR